MVKIELMLAVELVFKLLEYCTDACCQFIELMTQTGADVFELDYKTNIQLVHHVCARENITFTGNIDP